MAQTATPLRIAHRGMPRLARENTLASFQLAIDAGADGIELDVHATADRVVVVHHDPVLPDGLVIADSSHAALQEAAPDAPTLSEVCDLVNGRAELFVEIKGASMEYEVAAVLEKRNVACAIHSFDHDAIRRLHDSGSPLRLGVLFDGAEDGLSLMDRCGAMDLWPHLGLVTRALVIGVHARGGRIIPWTVNEAADIKRLRVLGVDGLCTDDVRMLRG